MTNTLNIPTTKTKAALVSCFILLHSFFLAAVESLPLWIQLDHLCQRTSLGLRKTLLKSFLYLLHLEYSRLYQVSDIFKTFPKGHCSYQFFTHPLLHFPHAKCGAVHGPAGVRAGISIKICTKCICCSQGPSGLCTRSTQY